MIRDYSDITDKLGDPLWYDGNGVPRYAPFHPDLCDVYNRYVALTDIQCQSCRKHFVVAVERSMLTFNPKPPLELPNPSNPWDWHYGDPPGHGCTGDSMNTIEVAIHEFWERASLIGWERKPQYEVIFNNTDI